MAHDAPIPPAFLHGPSSGAYVGDETEWLVLGSVHHGGKEMIVTDPSLFPAGVTLSLVAGEYVLYGRICRRDGVVAISGLRAVLAGNDAYRRDEVGRVSVDFSRLTIADKQLIEEAGNLMTPENLDRFTASLATPGLAGVIDWGRTQTIWVKCGEFSSGEYPVFKLVDGIAGVGIEVDLLGDDR